MKRGISSTLIAGEFDLLDASEWFLLLCRVVDRLDKFESQVINLNLKKSVLILGNSSAASTGHSFDAEWTRQWAFSNNCSRRSIMPSNSNVLQKPCRRKRLTLQSAGASVIIF